MNKLTDEQIQDYLDGNLSAAERDAVDSVLRQSPAERDRFNHYKSLFMSLEEDPGFELSPDFAHSVVVGMKEDTTEKALFKFSQVVLWLVGIAAALAVAFHFSNIGQILGDYKGLKGEGSNIVTTFLNSFKQLFEDLHIDPIFIGMIIVVLGAIFLIDRAISRVRNNTASMFC